MEKKNKYEKNNPQTIFFCKLGEELFNLEHPGPVHGIPMFCRTLRMLSILKSYYFELPFPPKLVSSWGESANEIIPNSLAWKTVTLSVDCKQEQNCPEHLLLPWPLSEQFTALI